MKKKLLKIFLNILFLYLFISGILFTCLLLLPDEKSQKIKSDNKHGDAIEFNINLNKEPDFLYSFLTLVDNDFFESLKKEDTFSFKDNQKMQAADDALYNYLLALSKEIFKKKKVKEFIPNFNRDEIWSVYYDLDDDKEDEIIGVYRDKAFCTDGNCPLFILKKFEGKYMDIYMEFIPSNVYFISILENKTNDFHDIALLPWEFYDDDEESIIILSYRDTK